MSDQEKIQGNDQDRWDKLLRALDEKLQLGLLEHLRRVESYEFLGDTLKICPQPNDREYLKKPAVFQQLALLSQDAVGISKIEIQE
ncbi:MAG: hypothetical protein KDD62_06225 [Bdellovibrionales bacterium]|nr:hypothetical protein [Bdellovibrionales bacterium]